MFFESLNASLCWIASVVAGWCKLVFNVFLFQVLNEEIGDFIVQSDDCSFESVGLESIVACSETVENVMFVSGFDWLCVDAVGIMITHQQDVFVSSPGRNRVSTEWVHCSEVFDVVTDVCEHVLSGDQSKAHSVGF